MTSLSNSPWINNIAERSNDLKCLVPLLGTYIAIKNIRDKINDNKSTFGTVVDNILRGIPIIGFFYGGIKLIAFKYKGGDWSKLSFTEKKTNIVAQNILEVKAGGVFSLANVAEEAVANVAEEAALNFTGTACQSLLTKEEEAQLHTYITKHRESWTKSLEPENVIKINKDKDLPRSLHLYKDKGGNLKISVLLKTKKGAFPLLGKGSFKKVKYAQEYDSKKLYANFSIVGEKNIAEAKREVNIMKHLEGKTGIAEPSLYLIQGKTKDNQDKISGMQRLYNGGNMLNIIDSHYAGPIGIPIGTILSVTEKRTKLIKEMLEYLKECDSQVIQPALQAIKELDSPELPYDREIDRVQIRKKILDLLPEQQDENFYKPLEASLNTILKEWVTRKEKKLICKDILNGIIEMKKAEVVHRDIKPMNIFLERDKNGNIISAKIADFGVGCLIAGLTEEEWKEQSDVFGQRNLRYNAPEYLKIFDVAKYDRVKSSGSFYCDYKQRAKEARSLIFADESYQAAVVLADCVHQSYGVPVLEPEREFTVKSRGGKAYKEVVDSVKHSLWRGRQNPKEGTLEHIIWSLTLEDPEKRMSVDDALKALNENKVE